MGLRTGIPSVRPEDIIEASEQKLDLSPEEIQQLSSLGAQPEEEQQNEIEQAEEQQGEIVGPGQVDPSRSIASTPDFNSFLQNFVTAEPESSRSPVPPEQVDVASAAVRTALNDRGFVEKAIERLQLSFAGNKEDQALTLKKKFGKDNVKVTREGTDTNIFFRESSADEFQLFDEEEFTALDVFDFGGDVTEAVVGALTEIGLIAGATAITGGLGAAPAVAAAMTGATAGGATGRLARRGVFSATGGEFAEDNLISDVGIEAGLGLLFLPGGKIVKNVLSRFSGLVKRIGGAITGSDAVGRIKQLRLINETIDTGIREIAEPVSAKESGKLVFGAIEAKHEKLAKEIGLLKNEAIDADPEAVFSPDAFFENTFDIFKDQSVLVNGKTFKARVTNRTANLKDPRGKEALNKIADKYNDVVDIVQATGGLTIDQIDDFTGFFQGLGFDEAFKGSSRKVRNAFKGVATGLKVDRDVSILNALNGSKSLETIQETFKEFSSSANSIRDFKSMFHRNESHEVFADALVRKDNSVRLSKVRSILGEESKEWLTFKSSFLNQKMRDATSVSNGIFDASKFANSLSDKVLGEDVRREFMPDSEFRKIVKTATMFEKIKKSDILNKPEEGIVQDMIQVFSAFRASKIRAALSIAKTNAYASDHLLKDGFVDLAEKAGSEIEKKRLLQVKGAVRKILGLGIRIKDKNGNEFYKITPAARNMARLFIDQDLRTVSSTWDDKGERPEFLEPEEGIRSSGDPDIDAFLQEE